MPLFNFPKFRIINSEQIENDKCIVVETVEKPVNCLICRNMFPKLYSHGSRVQFFHDLPIHGKRLALKVHRKRFKCTECGGTFEEPLEDMHPDHNMTKRLVDYIGTESYCKTFARIAEETGVTEKTVRNIFADRVADLRKENPVETPEILGIDEIHINTPRCVFTNIKEKTIIEMLPKRKKADVVKFLLTPDRSAVKLVTIDMWEPYKDAVYATLPKAKVIVDKFHVQRIGNNILERIRRKQKDSLTKKQNRQLKHERGIFGKRNFDLTEYEQKIMLDWNEVLPILGDAYEVKERFMDIWNTKTREEAMALYRAWVDRIPDHLTASFSEITTAFSNWSLEIFNYFDHPFTNSFTEALNGKIREIHRAGRGHSFDVLRAKILFREGFQKKKVLTPKFNKEVFAFSRIMAETPDEHFINYGVDISTLLTFKNYDSL